MEALESVMVFGHPNRTHRSMISFSLRVPTIQQSKLYFDCNKHQAHNAARNLTPLCLLVRNPLAFGPTTSPRTIFAYACSSRPLVDSPVLNTPDLYRNISICRYCNFSGLIYTVLSLFHMEELGSPIIVNWYEKGTNWKIKMPTLFRFPA